MDRYVFVIEAMFAETGETVEDCLDATSRAINAPRDEFLPENVFPMTDRLAVFVHHGGVPKGWRTVNGFVDLTDKPEARKAAVLQFLDGLPKYFEEHPIGADIDHLHVTFAQASQDVADLDRAVYVIEFGQGRGTHHRIDRPSDGDWTAAIRTAVQDAAHEAWDADEDAIIKRAQCV